MKIETKFENIDNLIISRLKNSESSIKAALAYFTDDNIFSVLCEKACNGLDVNLIISNSDSNFIDNKIDFGYLSQCGGKFSLIDSSEHLMHHKFCIIDDSIVITGSYNWTNRAAKYNYENIIVIEENDEVIQNFKNEFDKLIANSYDRSALNSSFECIADISKNVISEIQETSKKEISLSGIPTGFIKLDRIISGLNKSDIILISSLPGIGKTSFALSLVRNVAVDFGKTVAYFSLKMTKDKLTRRLLALETKISNDKLKVGRLDNNEWEHLDERLKAIVNTKIYIDDSPNLCLKELIYRSKKLYYQKNIDLIIIDYLELLKSDNSKNETSNNKFQREFELTCFTRDLKILARELNIPIIILSQLNRGSDSKTQITPSLKDLANGLENHMDVIIFIRRPEMYGFLEDEDGNSLKGIADIKIVKNNDGYIGNFYLRFLEESLSFEEYFEEDVNTIIPPSFGSKMNNNWNGDSPF